VEVLARVRAGHDRDLCGLEVEGGDAARFDEREQPERLDGRAQRDQPVRVPELADDPPGRVGSTMSPRWTLSSMPLRSWRATIGATIRHAQASASSGAWRERQGRHDPRIPRRLLR
jgi:hypothetical protein